MARKMPLGLVPQRPKPPLDETAVSNGEPKPPAARGQPPLSKDEINRLIGDLNAELASDDKATVAEAQQLCRRLSKCAAQRLGLIVVGLQAATVPQIVMSSMTILKGAGVVGTADAGGTAETVIE
jgi:hypothetical protein